LKRPTFVGFWSYKGGTGRSLACSNVALALSSIGKNIVVVDFDLHAPSQPAKFKDFNLSPYEMAKGKSPSRSGLVEYIERIIFKGEEPSLRSYLRRVNIPWRQHQPKSGYILLLPAFEPVAGPYWKLLQKHCYRDVYGAYRPVSEKKRLSELEWLLSDSSHSITSYLKEVLPIAYAEKESLHDRFVAQITALDPIPDFVLIDMTSGVPETFGILVSEYLNTIVALFSHNEESIPVIRKLGESLKGTEVRFIPVLTRVWRSSQEQIGMNMPEALKNLIRRDDEVCIISEDRYLEIAEDIALFPRHRMTKGVSQERVHPYIFRQVSHDYIDLASRLVASRDPKKQFTKWMEEREKTKSDIRGRLEVPTESLQSELVFALFKETGEVVNIVDNTRNVAFKVDTFLGLFRDLYTSLEKRLVKARTPGLSSSSVKKTFETSLLEAGHACGARFGDSLRNLWLRERARHDNAFKVKNWCEFDSDSGWGL